ncbi:hypothetical protein DFH09DRAFT_1414751 [Mycena vulgaris]|nr:hypothetical protein DFH09DRAFT_1414751 [Mycena vulgaris]
MNFGCPFLLNWTDRIQFKRRRRFRIEPDRTHSKRNLAKGNSLESKTEGSAVGLEYHPLTALARLTSAFTSGTGRIHLRSPWWTWCHKVSSSSGFTSSETPRNNSSRDKTFDTDTSFTGVIIVQMGNVVRMITIVHITSVLGTSGDRISVEGKFRVVSQTVSVFIGRILSVRRRDRWPSHARDIISAGRPTHSRERKSNMVVGLPSTANIGGWAKHSHRRLSSGGVGS